MGRKDKPVVSNSSLGVSVGAQLRLARQAKHMTLVKLADQLGYSKEHLSRVENDVVQPSDELVAAYNQALGSSVIIAHVERLDGGGGVGDDSPEGMVIEIQIDDELKRSIEKVRRLFENMGPGNASLSDEKIIEMALRRLFKDKLVD